MKIQLTASERTKLQTLFATAESNMADADAYNAILAKKTPVKEEKNPLLIREIDPESYRHDDYYQKVKPLEFQSKGWTLFYDTYKPYEGFVYDELSIDPLTYKETTRFGYFTSAFPFLALAQDGRTWMSVTPHDESLLFAWIC